MLVNHLPTIAELSNIGMRILHFHNIANQAWALAQGLRRLGQTVEVWEFRKTPFQFPCDRMLDATKASGQLYWSLLAEAIERFEVIHFHYSYSLFWRSREGLPLYWDLPILKALGKKVFYTFHGSDVRLKSLDVKLHRWSYFRFSDIPCNEPEVNWRRKVITHYADRAFLTSPLDLCYAPDLIWHPRAIDLDEWPYIGPSQGERPLIVHPYTDERTKGTTFVRRGLAQLEREGYKFDVRYVEGIPYSECKRALQKADIVIDRLVHGDYGLTSIEGMALGKAVVAQIEDEVLREIPDLPIYRCNPDNFISRMRTLVRDTHLREELGRKGREFVIRHHECTRVASTLLAYYEQPPRVIREAPPYWNPPSAIATRSPTIRRRKLLQAGARFKRRVAALVRHEKSSK